MTSPAAELHYISRPPANPDPPQSLLVLLHGYGSNEADLMGLAPYLDPRLGVVSVRAPITLAMGGHAWYELDWTPQGLRLDMAAAIAARDQVAALVQTLCSQWAVAAENLYLLGFSQGAGLALSAALELPQRLGGVAFLSGLFLREALPQKDLEHLQDLPVLMTHGRHDQTIPLADGQATRELISTLPLKLEYREYDMAHEINAACLEDLRTWFQERLGA